MKRNMIIRQWEKMKESLPAGRRVPGRVHILQIKKKSDLGRGRTGSSGYETTVRRDI